MKDSKSFCRLLALALVLIMILCACNAQTQDTQKTDPSTSPSSQPVSQPSGSEPPQQTEPSQSQSTAPSQQPSVIPPETQPGTQPTTPPATVPATQPSTQPTTQPTTPAATQPTTPPVVEPQYEDVTTAADFLTALQMAGGEKKKPTTDLTVGKFTFAAGCYFESSYGSYFSEYPGNINTQGKNITIVLSGTVNSIKLDARGASSDKECVLTLYKQNGTEPVFTSIGVANGTLEENIEIKNLEPGTYVLKSSCSVRIGDLTVTEQLEKAQANAIEVTVASNEILAGRSVSAEGILVELVYANGRRDVLNETDYTVDLSKVNNSLSGKYTVTVTHTATGFQDTYDFVVYTVDSIEISNHSLDSSRVTHWVQTLYLAGGSYQNYEHAAVIATCSAKGVSGTKTFVLQSGEFTFTPATDSSKKITATVNSSICTGRAATASYAVEILQVSASVHKTHIIVDANGTVGEGSDHVVTVKTVNDALRLFQLLGAPAEQRKVITICPGTYFEKVDISIPNLSIIAKEGSKAEDIVIVYNALNGLMDPSGTTAYSTDGSATFSLRAGATGFYGKGFTLMNYYNTHELYKESQDLAGSGTQAVACLIRADQVIFEGMRFSSYQDTLYAENGRHIFKDCYIEGRTDYIFGNDATSYFEGCTIHSIGAGVGDKNGGYVVATKGGSSTKQVEYGYIFNGCTFEGDENVRPGSVSIARGWAQYMTIMVMNCQLDDSFSLEAYGDTSSELNDRYTKMNADPVAAQLFEYNNTGAGALTEDLILSAVNGVIENLCTVPTAQRAADYADFTKIFAAKNGTFSYMEAWDGQLEN